MMVRRTLLTKLWSSGSLIVYTAQRRSAQAIPLFLSRVPAGFPSPADDYLDLKLDLNEHLIAHPDATFFVRVRGDSMLGAAILDGAILVVDCALEARSNDIVVCLYDGEYTVKRLQIREEGIWLRAENPAYPPIRVAPESRFEVWGIVTYWINPSHVRAGRL